MLQQVSDSIKSSTVTVVSFAQEQGGLLRLVPRLRRPILIPQNPVAPKISNERLEIFCHLAIRKQYAQGAFSCFGLLNLRERTSERTSPIAFFSSSAALLAEANDPLSRFNGALGLFHHTFKLLRSFRER